LEVSSKTNPITYNGATAKRVGMTKDCHVVNDVPARPGLAGGCVGIKYTDVSRILGEIKKTDYWFSTDGRGDRCPDAFYHG